MKRCPKCGEMKPRDHFGNRRPDKHGNVHQRSYCHDCERTLMLARQRAAGVPALRRLSTEDEKRCLKCGEMKAGDQFASRFDKKRQQHYLYRYCKQCERAHDRERRRAVDPTLLKLRAREQYVKHRDKRLAQEKAAQRWRHLDARQRAMAREAVSRSHAKRRGAEVIEVVDRIAIIERDNSRCYLWCKRRLTEREIELDHIVPPGRGGSHTSDNLRVACHRCNTRKGKRLLSEIPDLVPTPLQ